MERINPTFKRETLSEIEKEEFIEELFSELFDTADIHSDTDKVPDLSKVR